MSRASVTKGNALEAMALGRLRGMGCLVQRIATPMRLVRGKPVRTAKVFADIVGIDQNGKGLLVECKNYGRKPRPSDFREHQRDTLIEWHRRGGVALVAFVADGRFQMLPVEMVLSEPGVDLF